MENIAELKERILYEDAFCMLVNKSIGEALNKGGKTAVFLPEFLSTSLNIPQPFVVHRLDVPVSGALLLAKGKEAAHFYSKAFSRGKIKKIYWAIVEKGPALEKLLSQSKSGTLRHWLVFNTRENKAFAYDEEGPDRLRSRLRWRFLGEGERYAFLEIDLITGRHHQIRAQLAAIGLCIKGDLKYGAKRSEPAGGIRLHAASLQFSLLGDSDERKEVKAPILRKDALWEAFLAAIS